MNSLGTNNISINILKFKKLNILILVQQETPANYDDDDDDDGSDR